MFILLTCSFLIYADVWTLVLSNDRSNESTELIIIVFPITNITFSIAFPDANINILLYFPMIILHIILYSAII